MNVLLQKRSFLGLRRDRNPRTATISLMLRGLKQDISPSEGLAMVSKAYESRHPYGTNGAITDAFNFASDIHKGQLRDDGVTEYIMHPLDVAWRAAILGFGRNAVISALLHDVIEDGRVPRAYIDDHFGDNVGTVVSLLTKPRLADGQWVFPEDPGYAAIECEYKRIKHADPERGRALYAERAERYYPRLVDSGDVVAIILKVLDNLSNLRDFQAIKKSKRRKAVETIARWTLWLVPRFFSKEVYDYFAEKFRKAGVDIEAHLPYSSLRPSSSVVVFPPRADILSASGLQTLMAPGTYLSIYGDEDFLVENSWLEIGFPSILNPFELEGILRDLFPRFRVARVESLLPAPMSASELIFRFDFANGTSSNLPRDVLLRFQYGLLKSSLFSFQEKIVKPLLK